MSDYWQPELGTGVWLQGPGTSGLGQIAGGEGQVLTHSGCGARGYLNLVGQSGNARDSGSGAGPWGQGAGPGPSGGQGRV